MAMLDFVLSLLKIVGFWLVFVFVGANLLGFFVRGFFFVLPRTESQEQGIAAMFENEKRRLRRGHFVLTALGFVLLGAYFFALFHFWNLTLAVAAAMPMCARLPDLLWEIREGKKVTTKDGPKGAAYMIGYGVFFFGSLPVIWYALLKG